MKLLTILFFTILTFSTEYTAEEILKKSDMYRNAWDSFKIKTKLLSYVDEKLKEEGNFDVFVKGSDKSLVKFLNPDVKGQYLLMLEDNMWIYIPNTRKPIRITPLQKLMGDASNGDVARTNYTQDYSPKFIKEEILNEKDCFVLELTAKREGATYHKITYWIAKKDFLPQKAEFYLLSGKHCKTAAFDKYEEINKKTLLTQMTLVDRLKNGEKTILKYLEFNPTKIPDKYFNKDYLSELK